MVLFEKGKGTLFGGFSVSFGDSGLERRHCGAKLSSNGVSPTDKPKKRNKKPQDKLPISDDVKFETQDFGNSPIFAEGVSLLNRALPVPS